jgi:hypothetical protein
MFTVLGSFFSFNITRIHLDDIRILTGSRTTNGIATNYHINESPKLEQPHF